MIKDVEIKDLVTHKDERGFFREVIRFNDPIFTASTSFGQWSHSLMSKDSVKAWHYHHKQIDWWYVGMGILKVVLIDYREESPTYKERFEFLMGDGENARCCTVKIPQGVLHGCKCLTESAHLLYITSETYNTNDEGRYAFNNPEIDYIWGDEETLTVAKNDRKDFVPLLRRT